MAGSRRTVAGPTTSLSTRLRSARGSRPRARFGVRRVAHPDAERLIDEHFGLASNVLRVTSDGTGIYLQPRGTIRGHVVDATGTPLTEPDLLLDWQSPSGGSCGTGDMGYGPGGAEGFELPCTPGRWTIRVLRLDEAPTVLGEATVDVPAGGVAEVTIVTSGG